MTTEEDKLGCPICIEVYNTQDNLPYIGSCGHSICKVCWEQLIYTEKNTTCCICKRVDAFAEAQPNDSAIKILGLIDQAQNDWAALQETKNHFANLNNDSGEEYLNSVIFVKNIPRSWTSNDVHRHFNSYGRIKDATFGNNLNQNNGIVTVEYYSSQEADRAIKEMNRKVIGGTALSVALKKNSPRNPDRLQAFEKVAAIRTQANELTVHVWGLGTVTDEELRRVFGKDGPIRHVTILTDRFGNQRGEARIRFDSHQGVKRALERHLKPFGPGRPKITVSSVSSPAPIKL